MLKIGLTTTIPVEVIYAANLRPVDLNNVFITSDDPGALTEIAELAGYPRNICSWIKGIYGTVLSNEDIKTVIAVTQGDCSNTHALMETLQLEGINIVPFAYPFDRDMDILKVQIEKLMHFFDVTKEQVCEVKKALDDIRRKVWLFDEMTWKNNTVPGWDNHLFQVNCSDFGGDPEKFAISVDEAISKAKSQRPFNEKVRLAYIGVPPIVSDLYQYVEEQRARIVYNEVQRQFSMPFDTKDIVKQYSLYTYPYGIFWRLCDIKNELGKRRIDGIIHYAQSFCYRQVEDLIIRKSIKLPVLTLEGDKPAPLDARTRMRLDAFIDMLKE